MGTRRKRSEILCYSRELKVEILRRIHAEQLDLRALLEDMDIPYREFVDRYLKYLRNGEDHEITEAMLLRLCDKLGIRIKLVLVLDQLPEDTRLDYSIRNDIRSRPPAMEGDDT